MPTYSDEAVLSRLHVNRLLVMSVTNYIERVALILESRPNASGEDEECLRLLDLAHAKLGEIRMREVETARMMLQFTADPMEDADTSATNVLQLDQSGSSA